MGEVVGVGVNNGSLSEALVRPEGCIKSRSGAHRTQQLSVGHRPVSYILLGEDRPKEVRARRGRLVGWDRSPLASPARRACATFLPGKETGLTALRRLRSAFCSSTTKWGRLGGGGSQQRHPEQSDGGTRGLNQEPIRHAPNSTVNC